MLPYKLAKALKLAKVIDTELPPPGSGKGYKPSCFVIPLVLMLHGGERKLEDLRELLEMKEFPASCTVGDWLRRIGKNGKGLLGLARVNKHLVVEILKRDLRKEYTLDTDATVIEAEMKEAKWTYKKEKGYQPLLGFLFELGLALGDGFRDGNIPAGAEALEFLKHCEEMMPQGKRIKCYRSDSAAYQAAVINRCFENGMLFTITADQDKGVEKPLKT